MTTVLGNTKVKAHFNLFLQVAFLLWGCFLVLGMGRGPANGVVGRIKSAAKRAVNVCRVVIQNAWQFADFCKSQFKNNAYDPQKGEVQHFLQEYFFVEEIPRDESLVVAVITPNTHSFYNICSPGQFCIIEAREVSCTCESCVECNGEECLNQAYASKWKAISLYTGKWRCCGGNNCELSLGPM